MIIWQYNPNDFLIMQYNPNVCKESHKKDQFFPSLNEKVLSINCGKVVCAENQRLFRATQESSALHKHVLNVRFMATN